MLVADVDLHRRLALQITRADPELVVVEMPVALPALNSSGNLHGGAVATLIDVATGHAAGLVARLDPAAQTLVTADLHVRYLGRPKTDLVRGEGRPVRAGRQLIVVEGRVLDSSDNLIATADVSFMIVSLRQPLAGAPQAAPGALDL